MDHTPWFAAAFIASSLAVAPRALAQVEFPDNGCMIRYQYDDAGNRTKREWYCWGNKAGEQEAESAQEDALKEGPLAANSLRTMPNPASNLLRVQLKLPVDDGLLELTSIEGQVIRSMRIAGDAAEFDVSALSAGTYHLRLTVGRERLITSFTVKHP